jgi:hypothetical protein
MELFVKDITRRNGQSSTQLSIDVVKTIIVNTPEYGFLYPVLARSLYKSFLFQTISFRSMRLEKLSIKGDGLYAASKSLREETTPVYKKGIGGWNSRIELSFMSREYGQGYRIILFFATRWFLRTPRGNQCAACQLARREQSIKELPQPTAIFLAARSRLPVGNSSLQSS